MCINFILSFLEEAHVINWKDFFMTTKHKRSFKKVDMGTNNQFHGTSIAFTNRFDRTDSIAIGRDVVVVP